MFYIFLLILVIAYGIYSWYSQATVVLKARFSPSSLIWTLIIISITFSMGYTDSSDPWLGMLISFFLVSSYLDGVGGLSEKNVIVSGSFRRSVKYSDLQKITLIPVPENVQQDRKRVMAIFTNMREQSFYMRFNKGIEELIPFLNDRTNQSVQIEIQNLM